TSVALAVRPAWISLSDAETIWMSRIDMNIPNTMIRKAISRRGAMRSDEAAALIDWGVAAAALAMAGSVRAAHGGGILEPANYCGWIMAGASRSASSSASAAPARVSTVV